LGRLVATYLSEKWGIVVVGITTPVPSVLQASFVGSQVLVLDGSVDRTRFLYNVLQEAYPLGIQTREDVVSEPKNPEGRASQNPRIAHTEPSSTPVV